MILFWTIVGVLFLILLFGYLAYYVRTQPQLKPGLGKEASREHLTVMARDPHWLYAYWDLPENVLEQSVEQLILRVYHLTDTSQFDPKHTSFDDIRLRRETDNYHIKDLQAGESYVLEIGTLSPDGTFQALARSRRVSTPHAGKGYMDPQWQPIDEAWQTDGSFGKASEYMQERND
ncbi:DUF4912 domain-containing protein [Metallumcola ferriviriculae]|uniref:DUF4912 domain-containing protein n=1 Tax=Metallumcola ferriviriculae TaxID=3039180 RepID=A0AAU0USL7_9FIRM|nr:DUF4912 domain-containing protein [Desulfitibacteraceae bacterium MK1]